MTDTAVTPVQSTELAGSASAAVHDMSVWGLFLQADWVVKLVMFGLLLASFYSWAIIIEKYTRFKTLRFKSSKFENDFWSTADLERFYEKVRKKANHPMAIIFVAGMEEWYRSKVRDLASVNAQVRHNLQARITQLMGVAKNRELDKLESGLGFLATVGSAAPFIGLFGTVWGIMNSFTHIAASKNTSLAVVAPGIAEALFATAIGLFAAIPAVIAYNKFSGELDKFAGRLEDFSTEFNTLLSRQIDGGSN